MPAEPLDYCFDLLTLALDAGERPGGYFRPEREARSYIRSARRLVARLLEGRP